jgi:hypothetical protein
LLDEPTAKTLYHFAEANRLLKCGLTLSTKIDDYLSSVKLTVDDANELYYSYLLNSNAKAYSASSNTKVTKSLNDLAKVDLVKKFNNKEWTYNGAKTLNIDSLRIASLLAHLSKDSSDLTDTRDYVVQGARNLLKQGVTEDGKVFYALTSAVTQKDSWLCSESVNYHLLDVITTSGSTDLLTAEQR